MVVPGSQEVKKEAENEGLADVFRAAGAEAQRRAMVLIANDGLLPLPATLGEAIDAANGDMAGSFVSEDFKEGVAHYLEKRAPAFTGR